MESLAQLLSNTREGQHRGREGGFPARVPAHYLLIVRGGVEPASQHLQPASEQAGEVGAGLTSHSSPQVMGRVARACSSLGTMFLVRKAHMEPLLNTSCQGRRISLADLPGGQG